MDGCVNNIPITFLKKHGDKIKALTPLVGPLSLSVAVKMVLNMHLIVSFNPFPVI